MSNPEFNPNPKPTRRSFISTLLLAGAGPFLTGVSGSEAKTAFKLKTPFEINSEISSFKSSDQLVKYLKDIVYSNTGSYHDFLLEFRDDDSVLKNEKVRSIIRQIDEYENKLLGLYKQASPDPRDIFVTRLTVEYASRMISLIMTVDANTKTGGVFTPKNPEELKAVIRKLTDQKSPNVFSAKAMLCFAEPSATNCAF